MRKTFQWQPLIGCSHYSPGCANCKTMQLVPGQLRKEVMEGGHVKRVDGEFVWTGKISLSEERMGQPGMLTEPHTIFVCPFGDLFHANVPDAWLNRIFDVMEFCQQHVFQLLTKRAARQAEYFARRYRGRAAPLHIVAGVSVERQQEADERLPWLRATKAAAKYVTVYPILGPVDLTPALAEKWLAIVAAGFEPERPADPAWIDQIRDACAAHGTPFLFSSALVGEPA